MTLRHELCPPCVMNIIQCSRYAQAKHARSCTPGLALRQAGQALTVLPSTPTHWLGRHCGPARRPSEAHVPCRVKGPSAGFVLWVCEHVRGQAAHCSCTRHMTFAFINERATRQARRAPSSSAHGSSPTSTPTKYCAALSHEGCSPSNSYKLDRPRDSHPFRSTQSCST